MPQISPIDIQRNLGGIAYPASKQEVVQQARESGAEEIVVKKLETLSNRRCNGPDDVMRDLNGDF